MTTIYFHVVPRAGAASGARASLAIVAVLLALAMGLVWLMPRFAPQNEP